MATERGQWTIKSKRLDAELQNACRMAAARQGMPTGDWIAESLRASALATLAGDDGIPGGTPSLPARSEDVRDKLLDELRAELGEDLVEAVQRSMAEVVERLAPQPAPQPVRPVSQDSAEWRSRRLRTMLRRGRR